MNKHDAHRNAAKSLVISFALSIIIAVGLAALYREYIPSFRSGSYSTQHKAGPLRGLPFRGPKDGTSVEMNFVLRFSGNYPELFDISVDDCLGNLTVNGVALPNLQLPACSLKKAMQVNLSEYIRPGDNSFQVTLRSFGGPARFDLLVSDSDPGVIALQGFFFAAVILLSIWSWRCLTRDRGASIIWLYVAGIVARILYLKTTPPGVRSHDYGNHLHYIAYVSQNLDFLPMERCVVPICEHPPLYYLLNAVWWKFMSLPSLNVMILAQEIQYGSFILSVWCLGAALWIGTILFDSPARQLHLKVYALILCVFPGLIIQGNQSNNDVLVTLISLLVFGLTVRAWKTNNTPSLVAAVIASAAGLLTKLNIVILFPTVVTVVLCHGHLSWVRKSALCLVPVIIVFLVNSLVFATNDQPSRVPGMSLHGLEVQTAPSNMLTFNPVEVLRHPFNNPWRDRERRNYFLEFLFKSAFFGEFSFRPVLGLVSRIILLTGMGLALFAFIEFIRQVIREKPLMTLPMWLTIGSGLMAIVSLRLRVPFSPTQDFRYISVVIVPVLYYVATTMNRQSPFMRCSVYFLSVVFFLCSFTFFVLLACR
jgi:hypothetical protein